MRCDGAGGDADESDQKALNDTMTSTGGAASSSGLRLPSSVGSCVLMGRNTVAALRSRTGKLTQVTFPTPLVLTCTHRCRGADSSVPLCVVSRRVASLLVSSRRQENKSLRGSFKDLHKEQRLIKKDQKAIQEKVRVPVRCHCLAPLPSPDALVWVVLCCAVQIEEWKSKAVDLQMLKFGQLVDIESLDKMASSMVRASCVLDVRLCLAVWWPCR
jgi:hypothetical protein